MNILIQCTSNNIVKFQLVHVEIVRGQTVCLIFMRGGLDNYMYVTAL